MIMDFHFGKESSISYMSPRFLARCLLKELAYRLSTPPPPPPPLQPRPPFHSLHNVLVSETSFPPQIKNSNQVI